MTEVLSNFSSLMTSFITRCISFVYRNVHTFRLAMLFILGDYVLYATDAKKYSGLLIRYTGKKLQPTYYLHIADFS